MKVFTEIFNSVKEGTFPETFLSLLQDPVTGIPMIASFVITILTILLVFVSATPKPQSKRINTKIKLDQPKIVDSVPCGEIENIAEYKDGKLVMCRCWKSEKFPYCDGSHAAHNKATGDNIGPLIISKPK